MRPWLAIMSAVLTVAGCSTFHGVAPNEPIPAHAMAAFGFDEPRLLEAGGMPPVYGLPAVSKVYGGTNTSRLTLAVANDCE